MNAEHPARVRSNSHQCHKFTEVMMMKEYEKPIMEVVVINGDVITGSYECDTEMPPIPICLGAEN